MNRAAIVGLATATVAGAAFLTRCGPPQAPPPPPPDVLVIVMDTTRADRCSLFGYGRPTTPRLAEFAREAIAFTDAWSPSPWTFPAHAAMFTGKAPWRVGIHPGGVPSLDPVHDTLAERLGASGWTTGCFTANAWIASHTRLDQGFSAVVPFYRSPDEEAAPRLHDAALDWMLRNRRESRRFFAFINNIEPHAPWSPTPEAAREFLRPDTPAPREAEARGLRYPRTVLAKFSEEPIDAGLTATVSDLYDGEVADLDRALGDLFDRMRAEGLLERTLVIVAGDHGEGLGDHGWYEHGGYLHRELLRVPLVVRPPRGGDGRIVTSVVELQDVFATVLDACGLTIPDDVDGRSLLRPPADGRVALAEEKLRPDLTDSIIRRAGPVAEPLRRLRRSAFDGRHHLIVDDGGSVELFDVRADPGETVNLASALPDVVTTLRGRIDARR